MTMVDKPGPRKDELIDDTVEACTAEEIAKLLKAMKSEPLKWQVIVRLLIETGMRVGECTACTDVDEGVITIKDGEVIKVPNNFWLPF